MNMKLLGSSLITASLLMGTVLNEGALAGSHIKIFRSRHHKVFHPHHRKVFRVHHHRSRSCRANHNRRNYIVTIANQTSKQQIYWIDGNKYQLSPGGQYTHNKIIGGDSRCRKGSIALPLLEFDKYANDKQFTSKVVRLNGRTSYYYFDGVSNTISLKKG
ncbi:hypothetical protein C1752_06400 [Acaryochloris thomasi RCC1774]|uniref:Uncharacterized protein n=1 Tax=Acaryochloris thomasi RCC1774 TaxID=1764569 RepID=A0A2W1JBP6_9CYAN|nr:hypothetical protein [Acaryochloris thomasi]PZD71473.1 hypothetical protein C1752_06400 [Acaryochloris thomasi RCC1774]